MTQIFLCYSIELTAFIAIHSGLGGLHIVRRPRLHFNEAQHISIPTDEINLPPPPGRTKISRHHHIAKPTQIEISILFAATPSPLMLRNFFRLQRVARQPVQRPNGRVRETAGKHENRSLHRHSRRYRQRWDVTAITSAPACPVMLSAARRKPSGVEAPLPVYRMRGTTYGRKPTALATTSAAKRRKITAPGVSRGTLRGLRGSPERAKDNCTQNNQSPEERPAAAASSITAAFPLRRTFTRITPVNAIAPPINESTFGTSPNHTQAIPIANTGMR